jgi:hypothetical protein
VGHESPPRLAVAARAGDRVLARFGEPATSFVVDVAPLGAVACLPERPEPLWTLSWQDDGDGWWSFAAPVSGALGLRVRRADGRRSSDWRTVPAAAATPAAPTVTAAVDADGRVALWLSGADMVRLEQRPHDGAAWLDQGPRTGPRLAVGVWPPGAVPAWRLRTYAQGATGPALSPPVVVVVPVDPGQP